MDGGGLSLHQTVLFLFRTNSCCTVFTGEPEGSNRRGAIPRVGT